MALAGPALSLGAFLREQARRGRAPFTAKSGSSPAQSSDHKPPGLATAGLVSSLCGAPHCLASYFWHGALGKAPSPFAGLSLHGQNRLSRPHPPKRLPGARSPHGLPLAQGRLARTPRPELPVAGPHRHSVSHLLPHPGHLRQPAGRLAPGTAAARLWAPGGRCPTPLERAGDPPPAVLPTGARGLAFGSGCVRSCGLLGAAHGAQPRAGDAGLPKRVRLQAQSASDSGEYALAIGGVLDIEAGHSRGKDQTNPASAYDHNKHQ